MFFDRFDVKDYTRPREFGIYAFARWSLAQELPRSKHPYFVFIFSGRKRWPGWCRDVAIRSPDVIAPASEAARGNREDFRRKLLDIPQSTSKLVTSLNRAGCGDSLSHRLRRGQNARWAFRSYGS
jgi:hypothetical protein